MATLKIQANGITDVGISKEVNQDNITYKIVTSNEDYCGLFAVADGVGGLSSGEIASEIAVSNLNRWWYGELRDNYNDKEKLLNTLVSNIKKTNEDIINYSNERNARVATTLSVLFIYKDNYYILHVGDSRIYRYNSEFTRLTVDHSTLVDRIADGKPYKKSVLTQCLGVRNDFEYYSASGPIENKDIFILCSDGIYKTISESDIAKIIRKNTSFFRTNWENICKDLTDEAKDRGETDNISIIVLRASK